MRFQFLFVAALMANINAEPIWADTGVRFQSCGTELRERLTAAYRRVLKRRGQQRALLTECMDRAYVVEHQRHGPEKLVSELRKAKVTTFKCRNLDVNASAHKLVLDRGLMKIDRDFVRDNSTNVVAGTIAHEMMHNRGYKHTGNPIGTDFYPNTVPEQIENCVEALEPNPYGVGDSDTPRAAGRDHYDARQMLGFALDGENNYVFGWDRNGTVFAGSTTRIHNYRHPYEFRVAPGVNRNDIVGFGLDGYNNMVFAWLRDGRVIAGSSNDLDSRRAPYRYRLPAGYSPADIVGMGVDGENDNNFAWYRDGRVSVGTSDNLGSRRAPYRYSLAPGYTPADVVGMAVDGENNMIFAFYRDGKVSAGTSDDLDRFRAPAPIITGR